MRDVREYLEHQENNVLIQLIMDRAMRERDWREQLLLQAAIHQPSGVDLETFRQSLIDAIDLEEYGFVEYSDVPAYTERIKVILSSIQNLLTEDHAEAVIELCEEAIPLLVRTFNQVDDSDGYVGGLLWDVAEMHHRACQIAQPDPEALARRLYEWEVHRGSDHDVFGGAVKTYADILGERGIAVFRELASVEWNTLPALTPGAPGQYESRRYRLTHIMEDFAKEAGDLEALVAIKQRNLASAYGYVEIAQLYQEEGQPDRALEWAERGRAAFPDQLDSRLRDFLVNAYHERGQFDQVMALVWQAFTENPRLGSYMNLSQEAQKGDQWPIWREKALTHIRQHIANPPQPRSRDRSLISHRLTPRYVDHSLLVEIFIWEGDLDQAWHEAETGGCQQHLWITLAERSETSHPEKALAIYQKRVEPLIQQTSNDAYAEAVGFLERILKLLQDLGRGLEFPELVASLSRTYKAKRNFVKLLKQKEWI